jgi:hypothetical protein
LPQAAVSALLLKTPTHTVPDPDDTVKVALALVTVPKALVTTTEKRAPLSPETVGGVV